MVHDRHPRLPFCRSQGNANIPDERKRPWEGIKLSRRETRIGKKGNKVEDTPSPLQRRRREEIQMVREGERREENRSGSFNFHRSRHVVAH